MVLAKFISIPATNIKLKADKILSLHNNEKSICPLSNHPNTRTLFPLNIYKQIKNSPKNDYTSALFNIPIKNTEVTTQKNIFLPTKYFFTFINLLETVPQKKIQITKLISHEQTINKSINARLESIKYTYQNIASKNIHSPSPQNKITINLLSEHRQNIPLFSSEELVCLRNYQKEYCNIKCFCYSHIEKIPSELKKPTNINNLITCSKEILPHNPFDYTVKIIKYNTTSSIPIQNIYSTSNDPFNPHYSKKRIGKFTRTKELASLYNLSELISNLEGSAIFDIDTIAHLQKIVHSDTVMYENASNIYESKDIKPNNLLYRYNSNPIAHNLDLSISKHHWTNHFCIAGHLVNKRICTNYFYDKASIDYRNQKPEELVMESQLYLPLISPQKTQKINLIRKINVPQVALKNTLSLPNISYINDMPSFFLNPLLSLINSNEVSIEPAIIKNAYEANSICRLLGNSINTLPTHEKLNTVSMKDVFTIQTRILNTNENNEHEFSCTISPNLSHFTTPLALHILYILDTSSSIEAHRFNTFKNAIIQSLDKLDENVTFNIAILSNGKIDFLHKNHITPSATSKNYIKRHLNKIEQSDNVPFNKLIALLKKEKLLASQYDIQRSCILLSDGNLSNNIRIDQPSLKDLLSIDAGNFALYTATAGDNNNEEMLSLLPKINHGFALFSQTHSSFPRKFSQMIKHIKEPLMHDIRVSFHGDQNKEAYLNSDISPLLLSNKSLTFFGKTNVKDYSKILIQGKIGSKWINISQEFALKEARIGRSILQKKLSNQKNLLSFYSFLKTKDESYLSETKNNSINYNNSIKNKIQ